MSDDLPDPPDVVEEAIENRTSISDIAGQYTRKDKAKNRLVVRVYRYLKRMPGGEQLKRYLLNDGSWHRLNAAARLTCPALEDEEEEESEDPIIELMAEGGVPIVSLSRGASDKRNVYSFWYAQISRNRPEAIDYVLEKQAPALQLRETESESGQGSTQFFDITPCTPSI
jgi:hypothetical protein